MMTKKYSLKNISEIAVDDQDFILRLVKTFLEAKTEIVLKELKEHFNL